MIRIARIAKVGVMLTVIGLGVSGCDSDGPPNEGDLRGTNNVMVSLPTIFSFLVLGFWAVRRRKAADA
jgi:hypothetical protein